MSVERTDEDGRFTVHLCLRPLSEAARRAARRGLSLGCASSSVGAGNSETLALSGDSLLEVIRNGEERWRYPHR